jgi:hypothetical protein
VENRIFGNVLESEVPIVGFKIFYLVFLDAPRGTKVEIAGVFIAEGAMLYFLGVPALV